MNPWILLCAAALLSVERLCYIWVWRHPEKFKNGCAALPFTARGRPVHTLRNLFYVFKLLQCAVFIGWCRYHGDGSLLTFAGGFSPIIAGGLLIVAGQVLNAFVFYRLGSVGVFYGRKFGHEVPWVREFPFSILDHPQYSGALLTIWGFFLLARFPQFDWYWLPLLETFYYAVGAHFER